jgi:hypothetical protein
MPNPLVPIAGAATGLCTGTILSDGKLMTPKEIGSFYVSIAKACYVATGSKRVACAAVLISCGIVVGPDPHQVPFIVACAAAARGADKL